MPLLMRSRQIVGVALALALGACSTDKPAPPPAPAGPTTIVEGRGAVDAAWLDERRLDYLRFDTSSFNPESPVNVLSHLARKRLEPGYAPAGVVPIDAWDAVIGDMDALSDGRDFQALTFLYIVLGYAGDSLLAPGLVARVEEALARFKFWYTEPTPAGVQDNAYYFSENHQLCFATVEYLTGLRVADRPIGADGAPGSEHAEHAKARLLAWLQHRLRFGFAEWHSNVYYQKDAIALLALIEHAADPELRVRAESVLDLLFLDLALHTLRGAYGVTHGRSYKKNKLSSTDESTWSLTKLVFATSTYDYAPSDAGATAFAATSRYIFPEIIRRAALDLEPQVVREHSSVPIAEKLPISAEPEAPYGLSYQGGRYLMVWWAMNAFTAWPAVPETVAEFERYALWDNGSLAAFTDFRAFAASPEFLQDLSARAWAMLNFGLLSEVSTYTYRNEDFMLSSALDFRKGAFNQQLHAWQATLDAQAVVFTNHPFRPLALSGDWLDDPENGGYWNGEASAPRSAQVENVAIHIYAPAYASTNAAPFEYFHYEPYTHAYFPQERFEEFSERGPWRFGRLGQGYVALYSHRPAEFLVYDGVTQATGGLTLPFDLRADGADNVWIVECGREADSGSFADFQDAVSTANIVVTSRGPGLPTGESDGFDVIFDSPSQGRIEFGWEAPLVVRGEELSLAGNARLENRYTTTPLDPAEIVVEEGGYGLRLDVQSAGRVVFGPNE